ncbi:MAG TPA: Ig-like domain-containing protein [Armatimonadota bacterium]|nr:Ig-like domain-containing protein [Armatimonadota bacterium]
MKHAFWLAALALAALALPARAAELKILEPADKTLVRGTVTFKVKPEDGPTDQFLSSPEVVIQDEYGGDIERLRVARDEKSGVCSTQFDTTQLKDGIYLVAVKYRTLEKGVKPTEVREDLTLGVRNTSVKPAKFSIEMDRTEFRTEDAADFTVKVYDSRGRLMPGARVAFKVDKGEVDSDAEITNGLGEASTSVQTEEPDTITLTITVENLPPVTRVLRFVK